MSVEQVTIAVLGATLLVMAGVNVFALIKLIPLIDSEDKGIHEVKGLAENNNALIQKLIGKLEAIAASPDEQAAWAEKFEAPFQGISADALDGLDDSMAATEALLGELENLDESEWAAWNNANQMQIRNLLKTAESQRRRLESLRMELDQARATILNMRSAASRQAMGAMQAAALQAKNTTIEAELWSAKADRGRLLKELKETQKELQALQARQGAAGEATASGDALPAGDATELTARIAELEARVADLTSARASLQALHDRTVLEKKFIEDAFIRIDQQLGLSTPLEKPADDSDEVLAL